MIKLQAFFGYLGRVLKLAEKPDFVGAKPPQNQVLKQTLATLSDLA
jgi:hypothetical protein